MHASGPGSFSSFSCLVFAFPYLTLPCLYFGIVGKSSLSRPSSLYHPSSLSIPDITTNSTIRSRSITKKQTIYHHHHHLYRKTHKNGPNNPPPKPSRPPRDNPSKQPPIPSDGRTPMRHVPGPRLRHLPGRHVGAALRRVHVRARGLGRVRGRVHPAVRGGVRLRRELLCDYRLHVLHRVLPRAVRRRGLGRGYGLDLGEVLRCWRCWFWFWFWFWGWE